MPKGIKETSGLIAISAQVAETGANTFTTTEVALPLDPLNQEVFVVYAIDLDLAACDSVDATVTQLRGSLSTVPRTTVGNISDSNVMAVERIQVDNQTTNVLMQAFSSQSHPPTTLEYLGIIATDNFSLNIQGTQQGSAKSMNARIYGVRGRADAQIYSALVQSELLS